MQQFKVKKFAVAQNRTEVSSATTKCTNHYTTTALDNFVKDLTNLKRAFANKRLEEETFNCGNT